MRPKRQSFDQLVTQNRQELLENKEAINSLEARLEKKQEENMKMEHQSKQ